MYSEQREQRHNGLSTEGQEKEICTLGTITVVPVMNTKKHRFH